MLRKLTCLALALALFSCNKDDDDPVTPAVVQESGPHFKVSFDSQTFEATTYQAILAEGQITIQAFRGANQESFTLSISGTAAGTYPANQNTVSYSAGIGGDVYTSVNPDNPGQDTGQIVITAVNTATKTLTGTFSCTGYHQSSTKVFSNGSFMMPYTSE